MITPLPGLPWSCSLSMPGASPMFGLQTGNGVDVERVHVLDGDTASNDLHAGLRSDFRRQWVLVLARRPVGYRRFIEDLRRR